MINQQGIELCLVSSHVIGPGVISMPGNVSIERGVIALQYLAADIHFTHQALS